MVMKVIFLFLFMVMKVIILLLVYDDESNYFVVSLWCHS